MLTTGCPVQPSSCSLFQTAGVFSRPVDQVLSPGKPSTTEELDACSDTTASGVASSVAASSLPSSPNEVATTSSHTTLPAGLPSVGSLGHFAGQCSRCCFHPKGRCMNGYDCRFCHFDHDKRRRKKTQPVFSSPTQRYGERSQALPANIDNASPSCMPPGLEAYNTGMMQGGLTCVSYSECPVQPYSLEGMTQSLPQETRTDVHTPLAQDYAMLAPPPWPAPSLPATSLEFQGPQFWTTDKVSEWLVSVGLGHLKEVFQEHRIRGDVLLDLSQTDLAEMGVQALGDRKRIIRAIALLRVPHLASPTSSPQGPVFA